MIEFNKLLSQYDYRFPKELIAQAPVKPRDAAKLLVYNRRSGRVFFDVFKNVGRYLPKGALLVFNQTKVIPARLMVTKDTGGKAQLLYIDSDKQFIKVLADKKLKDGTILKIKSQAYFIVAGRQDRFYLLSPLFPIKKIKAILNRFGLTPLPPYIKHSPLKEDKLRTEYQSVFAKNGLSVAAPTASLHFTKALLAKLKTQGLGAQFVTLNVNLGTFAPLKEGNIKTGTLHTESYHITAAAALAINKAKQAGRPIIAVGTTVARTLESAAADGQIKNLAGETNLFIQEGYKFQIVDGLITNFHVPKSSLLMLVAALTGREQLFKLYQKAIKNNFRLFSFGDGMLIL